MTACGLGPLANTKLPKLHLGRCNSKFHVVGEEGGGSEVNLY